MLVQFFAGMENPFCQSHVLCPALQRVEHCRVHLGFCTNLACKRDVLDDSDIVLWDRSLCAKTVLLDFENRMRASGYVYCYPQPELYAAIGGFIEAVHRYTRSLGVGASMPRYGDVCRERSVFVKSVVTTHVYHHMFATSLSTWSAEPMPLYVMLRRHITAEWELHSWRDVVKKCHVGSYSALLGSGLDAECFQVVASMLGVRYDGPRFDTYGTEDASYIGCGGLIPSFPSTRPAIERATYWKWYHQDSSQDVIVASMDKMLNLLLVVFKGDIANPIRSWVSVLPPVMDMQEKRLYDTNVCHPQSTVGETMPCDELSSLVRAFLDVQSATTWVDRGTNVARPWLYDDYAALARAYGGVYVGVRNAAVLTALGDDSVVPRRIPKTWWCSNGVWRLPAHEKVGIDEEPPLEEEEVSFYHLHMRLQRRQPTYKAFRRVMHVLESAEECITMDKLQCQFPGVRKELLEILWESDIAIETWEKDADQWLTKIGNALPALVEESSEPRSSRGICHSNKASLSRTEQVDMFRAKKLQNDLSDLTRLVPSFDRPKACASLALADQAIPPKSTSGLRIASQRGLKLILFDYIRRLLDREKEMFRLAAAELNQTPATGESVDFEQKYERLPLSDLLTDVIKRHSADKCFGKGRRW